MRKWIVIALVLAGMLASGPFIASAQEELPVREAWEYKVVYLLDLVGVSVSTDLNRLMSPDNRPMREAATLAKFNELGAEGWEFVQESNDYFYFKRRR